MPNVNLLPSCLPPLPPPDKLDQPLSALGGASSSTSKLIPIPDVLSTAVVGLVAELLTTELRHTLTLGSPGGMLREPEPEPDAALNGDAGRGAGMSSTSMSEYCMPMSMPIPTIDCGRVAASYVGGLSSARYSLLCPFDDVDWRTSRCSGDGWG